MIFELPKSNYKRVQPLFEGINDHMGVKSIIALTITGKIWVDDLLNPKTACLWDKKGRLYLGGRAADRFNHSLHQLLMGEVATEAKKQDIDTFVLYFPSKTSWENHLRKDTIFENLRKQTRSYYVFNELKIPWKDRIPQGYSVKRIDKELLEDTNLQNLNRVIEEIVSMNQSIEEFLERGFDFCILHEEKNTIVCWCTSEYMIGLKCDFGIETVEEYQNQGFGTLIATATVDYGSLNGFHMGWDAWSDNLGSKKIAEKIGFEKVADYPVYYGCFDKHLH